MRKHLLVVLSCLLMPMTLASEGNYLVKSIELVNNEEVPKEVITSLMQSKVGERYTTDAMLEDYKKIKGQEYIEEVTIYPKFYDGGIRLTIDLQEKKDSRNILTQKGVVPLSDRENVDPSLIISEINIIGGRQIPRAELVSKIPVKVGGKFSRNKIIEGQKNLYETGYFRDVEPDVYRDDKGLIVVYSLIENPVVKGVKITGNHKYTAEELLKGSKIVPGEVLNINYLREDRDRILAKYQDQGYTLTDITDIDVNDKNEIEIAVNEGIVRNVQFKKMVTKQKGARRQASDDVLKTADYVIEREIEIKPGEIFNINDYNETSKNLTRLGHFKNVKYEVRDIPGDEEGKNIVLLLEEERTATLQGAISYGSEVGLLGMLSVKDTNWQGKGQDFGVTFEKSNKEYTSFSIDFYDPWIKDTDRISWGWSLYKTDYENDESYLYNQIDTYGAKANIGKGLNKYVRLNLGTKAEYVTEKNEDGKKTDQYGLWSLFPSITYDSRNHFWNPTSGNYVKYQVEGGFAGGHKAGPFGNTTLELRTYHRGFFKNNTFAYKAVFGIATESTKESQRFWVGGGNSLRGYDGGYFQGREKIVGTIENRTQINDFMGVVLFSDIGRAWNQKGADPTYTHDAEFPDDIATTVGFGLRLNTPIGPLRFDFGWPVGDKEESGMKFYFNMGQSF